MASTWDEIIDGLGGTGEAAEALGEAKSTVSGWRSRGIPAPHWSAVVRLATDRGRTDVSLEALADLAAREKSIEPVEARA